MGIFFFFFKFIQVSNLYTQHRAGTHNLKSKSPILHQLSQPGDWNGNPEYLICRCGSSLWTKPRIKRKWELEGAIPNLWKASIQTQTRTLRRMRTGTPATGLSQDLSGRLGLVATLP